MMIMLRLLVLRAEDLQLNATIEILLSGYIFATRAKMLRFSPSRNAAQTQSLALQVPGDLATAVSILVRALVRYTFSRRSASRP